MNVVQRIPPDFYLGSPIDPPDLWFRDQFIDDLWAVLDRQHGLLTAPRRTGKTSVMDYLAAYPQKEFSPIQVFVQDHDHPGGGSFSLCSIHSTTDIRTFSRSVSAPVRGLFAMS